QVDVGMADAAVEDVDLHVARAGHAAFDREGRQRRAGGLGGIGGDHGNLGIGGGGPNDAASAGLQPASSTWPSPSASISATAAARAAWSVSRTKPIRKCTSPAGVREEWIDSRL